jgi:DNA-binding transcriptional ArsR family regulator
VARTTAAIATGRPGCSTSTTQLVALTGQSLGSVGRHLRILLDSRLIRRGRAGRSVLYSRTPAGDVIVGSATQAG